MGSPQLEAQILTNLAVDRGRSGAGSTPPSATWPRPADRPVRPGARDWQPFVWGVAAQVAAEARTQPKAAAQLLDRTFARRRPRDHDRWPYRDFHETAYQTYSPARRRPPGAGAPAGLQAAGRRGPRTGRLDQRGPDVGPVRLRQPVLAHRPAQGRPAAARHRSSRSRATLITTVLLAGSVLIAVLLAVSFLWIRRSRNEVRAANGKLSEANSPLEKALQRADRVPGHHQPRDPHAAERHPGHDPGDPRRTPSSTRTLREKIALVHGAGETMRALVDDILDIAKIETDGVTLNRAELRPAAAVRRDRAALDRTGRGQGPGAHARRRPGARAGSSRTPAACARSCST